MRSRSRSVVLLCLTSVAALQVLGAAAASTRTAPFDLEGKTFDSVRDSTGQGTLSISASSNKSTGALSVSSESSSSTATGGHAGIPVNVGPLFFPLGGTRVAIGKNYGKASASVSSFFAVGSGGVYTASVEISNLSVGGHFNSAALGSSSYSYTFATIFMVTTSQTVWNGNCGGPVPGGTFTTYTVTCQLSTPPGTSGIRVDAILTADTSSTGTASASASLSGTVSKMTLSP